MKQILILSLLAITILGCHKSNETYPIEITFACGRSDGKKSDFNFKCKDGKNKLEFNSVSTNGVNTIKRNINKGEKFSLSIEAPSNSNTDYIVTILLSEVEPNTTYLYAKRGLNKIDLSGRFGE
jgi:hypothetical protein